MNASRWHIAPEHPAAATLERALGLPPAIAQVLAQRGLTEVAAARAFLTPQLRQLADPFELPDMGAAVERLLRALAANEAIVIYGDYDVDGLTAGALLARVLRAAGARVANFLPHRFDEGYGLSAEGLERCRREHRPDLLVAVDCGTTAVAEIAALAAGGIDVIVLDHHEPPATLPACVALVNPKRGRAGSPSRPSEPRASGSTVDYGRLGEPALPLASVGVAFKLAHALLKRAREHGRPWAATVDLREHLDLVALGTVADIVPLTGENRILVRTGLDRLAATDKPGLQALLAVAGVRGAVATHHVGFRLGPRLNAAGRLADASAALELLLTSEAARAADLAALLHQRNAERQRIEEQMVREAMARVAAEHDLARDRVLVLAQAGWHAGVIGIVAARLVQAFHRPAVVIALEGETGKGSCRSIDGFSIIGALTTPAVAVQLEKYGGHDMAAGLSLAAAQVASFRKALNAVASQALTADDLRPQVRLDGVIGLGELDPDFFEWWAALAPFGPANPTPRFAAKGLRLRGVPRRVGKNHLRFQVTDGETTVPAIWWDHAGETLPHGELDVAFTPELDDYRGESTVQLRIRDVRQATG